MAVLMNRTIATPRYAIRKLRPQALEESSCSISTKRPLHAAIEARIDWFACHHSQSGIVQDGLFLNRLHIPVNHLISSDITHDHHAQGLMAMARSEPHGIV